MRRALATFNLMPRPAVVLTYTKRAEISISTSRMVHIGPGASYRQEHRPNALIQA
jgi:hypothetical protein